MSIAIEDVQLSTIPFPVVFKISISPGFDMDQLKKLGFKTSFNYFMGINEHNPSEYDWVGRNDNVNNDNTSASGMCNKVSVPVNT